MSIVLNEVSKSIGGRNLFTVSMSFNPGNRYGLTGPNGSGKSTLLKIIVGQEPSNSGKVSLPRSTHYLRQNIEEFSHIRVLDTVIMGNERLWKALEEREFLYTQPVTDALGLRLGALEEIIAEEDGYTAESHAEELLAGIGVSEEYFGLPMKKIPLDMQFRVLLTQALFGNPQALLLDEPTNHLDLTSIRWLEQFLKAYSGILVVVSHDRHFLNSVTTHIADIDYETVIIYPGNYDEMLLTKTSAREKAELENKSKEKKIEKLQEFITRFGAGTRASQVQSRLREVEKLAPQKLKKSNIQRPYIRFPDPQKPSGQIALRADGISKSFDGKVVIKDFSLEVLRGEKIGVIGNNGLGKTTLMKLLANVLTPDKGKIQYGHEVRVSYFPQNHSEIISKSDERTIFDFLRSRKEKVTDEQIRSALGKMLFSGEDAFKKVAKLSGGETARLLFCSLMLEENNFLILDEPNNHLDLESVSALGWALEEYKGTSIVVSHDQDLIGRFATKILFFEKDKLSYFDGTLEQFLLKREAK